MKPYGKFGREINCCPYHDSTSKYMAVRSNKKHARQVAKKELSSAYYTYYYILTLDDTDIIMPLNMCKAILYAPPYSVIYPY